MTRMYPRNQARRFHEPLFPEDTEKQTLGCRHTQPDICSRNLLTNVCAFARQDGMCLVPPKTWPRQFRHLKQKAIGE